MVGNRLRPPGPRGGLLTGNLVAYDRDRLGFLRRCQRQYGDWVSIDSRTVLVGDAEAVSQTLYATNTVFSLETNNVEATGGPGALAERAAEHAMARRRIVRALAKSPVERHVPILHAILERQLTGLHGQRVDLTALLQRAFGTAAVQYMTSCDDAGLVEVIAELYAAGIAMTAESVDLPLWLPSGRRRRLRRATARAGMRLRELTERRLEDPGTTEHADVLGAALADSEFSAPGEDLEVGLMAALRSSFGGTGVAAAWAIKEVARRPEMRDRIEAEVSADGDLPYLSAVVKETFRLHPPVWLLLRDVLRPTRLGEWAFTPGDRLMICLRLLHSDPRWWPEPEVFNPDRWLGSRRLANPSVYLPFGTGPRACFGARLATVQLLAGLAYLWAHTRIELDDPDDMRETYSALLFPAQGHGRLWLRS